ncbi:MAG: M2 family metallopeptidase [Polyangiaceae bacterium]|jgi:peptidyl-dipeptidase A|nr:M2 family metallopeptidase [Polyangiaceae bacterium]
MERNRKAARTFGLGFWAAGWGLLLIAACAPEVPNKGAPAAGSATLASASASASGPATVEEARAFFDEVNTELKRLYANRETQGFVSMTYITDDTERLSAQSEEAVMAYLQRTIERAKRFEGVTLPPELERMRLLLRLAATVPSPSAPAERSELATLLATMSADYGKAKACAKDGGTCRDLGELSAVLKKSRKYDELAEAWAGWHDAAAPLKPKFSRYVELGNKGAKALGFRDLGEYWRSGYDMPADAFSADVERMWAQVKPLYDELHCYVRGRLAQTYGKDKVREGEPIPAHLFGNMWAQEWGEIYPLVEPYPNQGSLDVTKSLQQQKYDAVKMVKLAERFFTSLGLDPLPETFWKRSLFTKPRDREVVCHASAWDVTYNDDLRIKMCIEPDEENLITLHHELGHNYYFHYYYKLPVLFQAGANDGFHEGIGDTLALSVTPTYLKNAGLLDALPPANDQALVNQQLKMALEKVAFLPFGKVIDQWRWGVFSGAITPQNYNASWWAMRRKYQGVAPPIERSEANFDPGAKYHVPANTPYMRYFLARIYQFQFHRALCRAAGHTGPLHACSIYDNKAAGDKLANMLKLGASRPWPEALAAVSGEKQGDAAALLEYFEPLRTWLREKNQGARCGWSEGGTP